VGLPNKSIRKCLSIIVHDYRRFVYSKKQEVGRPVRFRVPGNMFIELYPQGQIVELLYTSSFEKNEIKLVIEYLKPGMTVVDVGANVGLYSILAGLNVGLAGKVFAFEPSEESHKRLLANLALNQVANIEVIKMALADTSNVSLYLKRDPGYRDGDRYLETRKIENARVTADLQDHGDSERVSVTTLDQYFYRENRKNAPVDFLKMDVEGGEFAVLRGASRFLTENHEIVLMFECAMQGCLCAGHSQDDVFHFLRDLGFGLYAWDANLKIWSADPAYLANAGNIWACRNRTSLPFSKSI
jgi:FkbM family methyltransferase